jgi:hypothetical protein
MSKSNPPQPFKKKEVSIVRSSAAEYLTFVAAGGQGGVEAVYADENVWITQKMMGLLYDVDVRVLPAFWERLEEVRRISHNFGYGVGDAMDELLVEFVADG